MAPTSSPDRLGRGGVPAGRVHVPATTRRERVTDLDRSLPPAKQDIPLAEAVMVWEAEDGRCEACTRAMDRTCARVATVPPSSVPRLLCPDCTNHRPDPLTTAVVGPQTAQALAGALATTVEASAAWLVAGLRTYGVLLRLDGRRRRYWLPGVGAFALFQAPASPPVVGGPLGKLRPH